MEEDYLLAVPSEAPGGIDSPRSAHFGHCPCFTVVRLNGGEVAGVEVVENPPHQAGGCLAPIGMLRKMGVRGVVVGGIGKRPLAGMQEAGITVLRAPVDQCPRVADAVRMLRDGRIAVMDPAFACTGHDCH
jgi:predicted Fe-Mo cluster-binding NifX family protein